MWKHDISKYRLSQFFQEGNSENLSEEQKGEQFEYIYRGQVDGTVDLNTAVKPPLNRRETAGKVPVNEQEQQIYKYVSENAGITTAQAMKLLGIKQRRTREILVKMVENGWLRKEGASRSTIYVKNTEGR